MLLYKSRLQPTTRAYKSRLQLEPTTPRLQLEPTTPRLQLEPTISDRSHMYVSWDRFSSTICERSLYTTLIRRTIYKKRSEYPITKLTISLSNKISSKIERFLFMSFT